LAAYTKTSRSDLSQTNSRSESSSTSVTRNVLDEQLLRAILGGLTGRMTHKELTDYAEQLLRPQLNASLEASRQQHETLQLAKEQEIENLARALSGSIAAQHGAYGRSMADIQTAALARGMGRSSYTLQSLANQGNALSQAVRELTEENERQTAQINRQISQSAKQNADTSARLYSDYAQQLSAKVQELDSQQRQEFNRNYMTAVSAAMGQMTQGTSQTTGESQTSGKSSTVTTSGKTGATGKSGAKKMTQDDVDAISGAAPSVKKQTKR